MTAINSVVRQWAKSARVDILAPRTAPRKPRPNVGAALALMVQPYTPPRIVPWYTAQATVTGREAHDCVTRKGTGRRDLRHLIHPEYFDRNYYPDNDRRHVSLRVHRAGGFHSRPRLEA